MSIHEKYDFAGKRVLVTGASSGIGRQTAITLSELGATVILVARREEELKATVSMMSGSGHRYYSADLAQTDKIEELMKSVYDDNGPLDGLAYCAGIATTLPVKSFSPAYVEKVMRINFFGFFEMVRLFAKKGRFNPEAKIVGISSKASTGSSKGQSAYGASKAAMDAAVRILSQELIEKKININTIRPAFVRTAMYDSYVNHADNAIDRVNNYQPLGVIEMEDVSEMVACLLSPASRFITGQNIEINGGHIN